MRTPEQIMATGIKETDWTYCKAEYAPHEGCKVGMPPASTPDGTAKADVATLYLVTTRFRNGKTVTNDGWMYLNDGRFYWYINLSDNETVEGQKKDEWWNEPIAWIPYRNINCSEIAFPIAPHKAEAVPTPPMQKAWRI